MRPLLLLALPSLLAVLGSGTAVSQPGCAPGREGEAACFDGKLCLCRDKPGGALTGRRPGPRWDCGTLRPACGPSAPADVARPDTGERDAAPPPFLPAPYPPAGWR